MLYSRYPYNSPIGILDIIADGEAITGIWFRSTTPVKYMNLDDSGINTPIKAAVTWLDAYFSGTHPPVQNLSLSLTGTAFQKTVWSVLTTIPYGTTMTYGQIGIIVAKALHKERMSAQAIGQAVGANPISIIVPCHRVIGANGKLVGYASGLEKKIWLLKHEGIL